MKLLDILKIVFSNHIKFFLNHIKLINDISLCIYVIINIFATNINAFYIEN